MKNLCYNKDTKEKEKNKKCFNLTKNKKENSNARIETAERGSAKCRRDTAKEKL